VVSEETENCRIQLPVAVIFCKLMRKWWWRCSTQTA